MAKTRGEGGAQEDAVAYSWFSRWKEVIVGVVSGAFVAGAAYAAAREDLAQAVELSNTTHAKVIELEAKARRVDVLEAQQRETAESLRRILVGLESMDRKLFALVCAKNPKRCEDQRYEPSVPPP